MYRVSPFTYLVSAMLATGLANTNVTCAANELLQFQPPQGETCGQYMAAYIDAAGGYLASPNATDTCRYCTISDTNVFLASVKSGYADRYRNFGLLWVYIAFNILGALALYWIARVPKNKTRSRKKQE